MKSAILKLMRYLELPGSLIFEAMDRFWVARTRNILKIPNLLNRFGGKSSYAEWAHVIGLFQAIIAENLPDDDGGRTMLDVGCGYGLVALSASQVLEPDDQYIGLDTIKRDIDYCRRAYPQENLRFVHHDHVNAMYNEAGEDFARWDIGDDSVNLVTAVSVWTHLRKKDSLDLMSEVSRVLAPGGRAVITFFCLDDDYDPDALAAATGRGRYHNTRAAKWVFNRPAYGAEHWRCPSWTAVPEQAIGVTPRAMEMLQETSGLEIVKKHPGNWKQRPGLYFQDVVVFEKRSA